MLKSTRSLLKVEGAGNDFIFIPYEQGVPTVEEVQTLCDRNFGIGADGLVVMESAGPKKTRWHFFNRDGSVAAMCGNAARAAAAWLEYRGKVSAVVAGSVFPHSLETLFGEVIVDRDTQGGYVARVPYANRPLRQVAIQTGPDTEVRVDPSVEGLTVGTPILVDTGVPHAVVELTCSVLESASVGRETLQSLALVFRWPKEAGAGGANVTFFSRVSPEIIEAVTFERGVEDLTLSCGTGVLAAALVSAASNWPSAGVEVRNPGAVLRVMSRDFPNELSLIGPARVVFAADYFPQSK
ncbi:MAG: diaminopimelate epimerase [Bdellovibrionales bacterium]|nr:diaminopimelate epimerase [Bdellovibrionales bacterium]